VSVHSNETTKPDTGFMEVLHSGSPARDRAEELQLYAWLVGDWEIEVRISNQDHSQKTARGTVHADCVLEGRAIQDVFAVPGMFYGTSLRFYDPHINAWQVFWVDPLKHVFFRMVGRAQGNDIINEGRETPELARAYGVPEDSNALMRWIFTDIRANSFHWMSQRSLDGKSWHLQREYFGRRMTSASRRQLSKAD
jgi:hypothetical protein